MKKEDFKEITKKHILACEWIIRENGKCADIKCSDCPFCHRNNIYDVTDCIGYAGITQRGSENLKLMKSAQEFLELFKKDFLENEKKSEVDNDKVNSPKHYKLEGLDIESIDVIFAVVRGINNGVIADCVGNILKYVMRAEKKNGLEDYKKARKYLDWCIEEKEKEED